MTRCPARYNPSTCSCPRVSMCIDQARVRMTAAPIGGNTESLSQVSSDGSNPLLIRHVLELQRVEPFVVAALDQELVMGSYLHDGAAVQDDNPVGPLNGGQSMSNHQCRSMLHQIA